MYLCRRKYLIKNRKVVLEKSKDYWKEHQEMEDSFVQSWKDQTQNAASKLKNQEEYSFDQNSSYNLTNSNGEKLISKHSNKLQANPQIVLAVTEGIKLHFQIFRKNKLLYPQFDLIDQYNRPIIFCKKVSLLSFSFSLKEGDWDQSSESYIGRLVSNISGSILNFFLKTAHKEEKEKLICSIEYTNSVFDFKKPRAIKVYMLELMKTRITIPKVNSLRELYEKQGVGSGVVYIQNKLPTYNKNSKGYSLDFHGRAPVSSIKNFILECSRWKGKEYLLFGKKGENEYNLDFMYPFSILHAFVVAVSNFNGKLVCE